MKISKLIKLPFLIFFGILIIVSCQDDWDFNYPYIRTIDFKPNNDTSVIFSGEIQNLGNKEIIEYGYCHANYGLYYPINEPAAEGKFSVILSNILRKNTTLSLKVYAKTKDYTILGNTVNYYCNLEIKPQILSITPISGNKDITRTMVVKYFCKSYNYGIMLNNGQMVIRDLNVIEPNTIEFKLPTNIEPGSYTVLYYNLGQVVYSEPIIVTAD